MLKDLILLKSYFVIVLFLGVWILLPSRSYNISLPGIYLAWIGAWFILVRTLWASDESVRCEAVINSLPLSKRDIVCGRHLTSLAFLVFGFLVMMTWVLILKLLGVPSLIPIPWTMVISTGLVLCAFVTIISFPIFFKLDYMKARWASLLIFIVIFSFMGQKSCVRGSQAIQWLDALYTVPNMLLISISVSIFAVFTWLSIEISTLVYRSREF